MGDRSLWHYAINTFDSVTTSSPQLMESLSSDHHAKLTAAEAEPGIDVVLGHFSPVRTAFSEAYTKYDATANEYHSATATFYGLLSRLSGDELEHWSSAIKVAYPSRTPQYKRFMPGGHEPFQKGSVDERIHQIKILMDATQSDPTLAVVHMRIKDFHDEISNARTTQRGLEGQVDSLSLDLEAARLLCAQAMHRSVGLLIANYWQNPEEIESFFDMNKIRKPAGGGAAPEPDPTVVLMLNAGATVESGITFEPGASLRIRNVGSSSIMACMGGEAGVPCDGTSPTVILLHPGEERTLTTTDLGAPTGGLLNLTNVHTSIRGEAEVFA